MKKDVNRRAKPAALTMREMLAQRKFLRPQPKIVEVPQPRVLGKEIPAGTGAKYLYQVLPQGAWKGHRCWIIGGGPSLKKFDMSLLKGELVIGINRAYEICDPAINIMMDQRLWGWIVRGDLGEEAKEKFDVYKGIKCWLETNKNVIPAEEGYFLKNVTNRFWSDDMTAGLHWGCNTGYSAINLAGLLGADPIYLLGYDMITPAEGDKGTKTWWHEGYPNEGQKAKVYKIFRDEFEKAAGAIKSAGVNVVNLNPKSGLEVFPRVSLAKAKIAPLRRPLVVSFYTSPEYKALAEHMAGSVHKFGLEVEVDEVVTRGSWLKNVQYKPEYMLEKLVENKRDILWMDADAIMARYPDLFDNFDGDIGVHYLEWEKYSNGRRKQRELLTGTVYLRYNPDVIAFMKAWIAAVAKEPMRYEQLTLQAVIETYKKPIKVVNLPAKYCAIFDIMASEEDAVIEQYQASRYLRNV